MPASHVNRFANSHGVGHGMGKAVGSNEVGKVANASTQCTEDDRKTMAYSSGS